MVYSGLGSDDNDQTSEEAGTGLGEAHAPVGVEAGTGAGTGAWLRGGSGGVGEEIIKGDYTVRDVRDVSDVEPAITGAVEPLPALRHVHFATLPGMWDRTVTISSAGKTFSVTGWQVCCMFTPPPHPTGKHMRSFGAVVCTQESTHKVSKSVSQAVLSRMQRALLCDPLDE